MAVDCGCGLVYIQKKMHKSTSSLPHPNNNRKIENANFEVNSCMPNPNLVKTVLIEEFLKHLLIFYFFWYEPDLTQIWLFGKNSSEECSKIINFFAFSQAFPIFLTIQGFLQIDKNMSKTVYLPLLIGDCFTIYATSRIRSFSENWSITMIIMISMHAASVVLKLRAYCVD